MKVYVVQSGCYDSEYIAGVYCSVEAAIAKHPVPAKDRNRVRDGGWQKDRWGVWSNGYDWDECDTITEYEVLGTDGA
jgi:hypothetical protein